jgi:hypothetical protein
MQLGDKTAIIGIVAGLAAGALGVGVPLAYPGLASTFWQGIVFVSAAVLAASLVYLLYLHLERGRRVIGILLIVIGVIGIAGGIGFLRSAKSPAKTEALGQAATGNRELNVEIYLDDTVRIKATPITFSNRDEMEKGFDAFLASPAAKAWQMAIAPDSKTVLLNVIVRNIGKDEIPDAKVTITALAPFTTITQPNNRMLDTQTSWNSPSLPDYSLLGRENYYSLQFTVPQPVNPICLWVLIEAPGYKPYFVAGCITYKHSQPTAPVSAPLPFEISLDSNNTQKFMPMSGHNQQEYAKYMGEHKDEIPTYNFEVYAPQNEVAPQPSLIKVFIRNTSGQEYPETKVTFVPTSHDLLISSTQREAKSDLYWNVYFERQQFKRFETFGEAQVYFLNVLVLNEAGSAVMSVFIQPTNAEPYGAVVRIAFKRVRVPETSAGGQVATNPAPAPASPPANRYPAEIASKLITVLHKDEDLLMKLNGVVNVSASQFNFRFLTEKDMDHQTGLQARLRQLEDIDNTITSIRKQMSDNHNELGWSIGKDIFDVLSGISSPNLEPPLNEYKQLLSMFIKQGASLDITVASSTLAQPNARFYQALSEYARQVNADL